MERPRLDLAGLDLAVDDLAGLDFAGDDLARDARVVDRLVLFLAGGILFTLREVVEDIGEPSGAPTTYQLSIKYQRLQSLIESRGIPCALGTAGMLAYHRFRLGTGGLE